MGGGVQPLRHRQPGRGSVLGHLVPWRHVRLVSWHDMVMGKGEYPLETLYLYFPGGLATSAATVASDHATDCSLGPSSAGLKQSHIMAHGSDHKVLQTLLIILSWKVF